MSRKRAIVVGGGIIGASCAYYLAKEELDVTVVDRDAFGRGCSDENCGLLAYSHVLPLTVPGAIRKSISDFFRGHSALRIKPRLSPALASWLTRFARNCNEKSMMRSARAIFGLIHSSRELYDRLQSDEGLECEMERRGCLFVHRSRKTLDAFAKTDRLLRDQFDTAADRYNADELLALEPAIMPGVAAGAWHYPGDMHLRPDRLLAELRRLIEARGATILEQCSASDVVCREGRAVAMRTDQGEIEGDYFVIATGAVTPEWSRQLGCRLPIQPGKGYSITMPRPKICPQMPIIFEEEHVAVTPMQTGYRLGSMMEFAGYDQSLNHRRMQLLVEGAKRYLREPIAEPIESRWFGWRPMTYDGVPIIGPAPKAPNVYIAAGHNMIGTTLAPATGQLIAELVTGRLPHIDPGPYSVERFG